MQRKRDTASAANSTQDSISGINSFILGNPDAFTSEAKRERLSEIMGAFVQANRDAAKSPHL